MARAALEGRGPVAGGPSQSSTNEPVMEPAAIGLDPPHGRAWKMNRQNDDAGVGDLAQEPPPRQRRLNGIPVEYR